MSQENVELVRRLIDAWNRRDLDAMLDLGGDVMAFVNSPTASNRALGVAGTRSLPPCGRSGDPG